MKVRLEDIKKLREKTSAGVADCRQALEEAKGKMDEAIKILRKKGLERAEKKADRAVKAGAVFSYVHHTGKVGSMIALACETDFVAKTDEFQKLGKELAMQVVSMRPENVEDFLQQDYARDPAKKIAEVIKEVVGKLGENIQVVDFKMVGV